MMPNVYQCDFCKVEMRTWSHVPGYYQINETLRIFAPSAPVWCKGCQRLSIAEALPESDSALQEIQRCDAREATQEEIDFHAELDYSLEDYFEGKKKWLSQCLKYLGSRVSNRCIRCGSSQFEYLEVDEFGHTPDELPCSGCKGRLKRNKTDDACINSVSLYFLLDLEGNLINDFPLD